MPDPNADRTLTVYEFTLQLVDPVDLTAYQFELRLVDLADLTADKIVVATNNGDIAIAMRDGRLYASFTVGSTSRASAVARAIRDLAAAGIAAEEVGDE